VDTQEIPILTEVYKTKSVKTQPDVVEVTPELRQMIANELRPSITQEVIETLKPQLEASITESLSQQLFAALSSHINAQILQTSEQLTTDITAHVSRDITNHLQQEVISPLQETLNGSLQHMQEARTLFEQSISEKLADSLAEQQAARQTFEQSLTEKLQLDHTQYAEALSQQSQQLLEATQTSLDNQMHQLVDTEIARVTSTTEANITALQDAAISNIKTQIADSESVSEDIFKYAVNKYTEQTQTRLFEEVGAQQLKFTEALQTYVATAQSDMQATLLEQVQTHIKTLMHQELTEQKQATLDVMADFYQVKVNESKESATQLAQTLSKELVQTVSMHANELTDDAIQHLKQAQEALLLEASARIRGQLEQELRVSADVVRQDFNHALNADLPEIQQLLATKVQELFVAELPNFEQIVMERAKVEVSQILSGIRLAFPS
jgi:hypothetical protein